jgi:hypothetical protein
MGTFLFGGGDPGNHNARAQWAAAPGACQRQRSYPGDNEVAVIDRAPSIDLSQIRLFICLSL